MDQDENITSRGKWALGVNKVVGKERLLPSPLTECTAGQRWRFRRDLVIYIASQNGASQRLLGDVFDLPHSRIAAIIKKFKEKYIGQSYDC